MTSELEAEVARLRQTLTRIGAEVARQISRADEDLRRALELLRELRESNSAGHWDARKYLEASRAADAFLANHAPKVPWGSQVDRTAASPPDSLQARAALLEEKP